MANMSEKVNEEEPLFLKSKHLNFSDDDLEWVLTHLKISKEDLDKKSIYVKRFIHEIVDVYTDEFCLILLNEFECAHETLIQSKYDQCKYFQLTKRFPDVYYELCKSFPDVKSDCCEGVTPGYTINDFAVQNFCKYSRQKAWFGYLSDLYVSLGTKFGTDGNWDQCKMNWDLSKCSNVEFDAHRFEWYVEIQMKQESIRVRRHSKEKGTRSKYKETVAYMQAKGVENQLLVDERTALHTQLLNSGASHKRFKTNVSAFISKKNSLIRDLQTRFSELESKNKDLTEQLLACRAAKSVSDTQLEECKDEKEDLAEQLSHTQSLLLQSIASRESLSKELTEQLLACIAAKDVSAAQLEECEAEKEDLTEQLCHTQSLLLQSIASIGKRKRVE